MSYIDWAKAIGKTVRDSKGEEMERSKMKILILLKLRKVCLPSDSPKDSIRYDGGANYFITNIYKTRN